MTYRILQVITPSRLAGAETLLARLATRLTERGHSVQVVCNRRSSGLDDLRRAGLQVAALPIGGKVNLRAVRVLRRAARESDAQFTHSHLSSASWWCGWLQSAGGPPSLGHVHGFTSALWHRRQRHLVACSRAVAEHLIAQGIEAQKITVLPNPVAPDDIRPQRDAETVRAEFGADAGTPVVGCFAHLSEKKGWRELLGAMPDVLRRHPDAQLWCVGGGPLRDELEAMARALCIENSVRFAGFRRDAADLMNAVDVMALPSHREPFGLVYVEAALLGKPVVACRAGGAPEVVDDGETGLLVPPHDAGALAQAVSLLLGDRVQGLRMGATGRERALSRFGWEPFLQGLETVYSTLAATSTSGPVSEPPLPE